MQRRGMLTTRLNPQALKECMIHLDGLARLRGSSVSRHRADIMGRLSIFLGHIARAVAADPGDAPDEAAHTHPAVLQAMRLLESRVPHKWTLNELAEELHLTPRYVIRLFRAATGLPPMTYLAQHRVEKAAYLLLHTGQSITQIGQAVGWADQNYFARRFKAHYGLTATTYRQRFTHHSVSLNSRPRD
jgi:AraC family L-rhamnose operon transcriptional activator RhaR